MNLQIGLISETTEEKIQKIKQENKPIILGITVESLYDYVNELEVITGYDFRKIINQLKYDMLIIKGKIEPSHNEEQKQ